jgi:hypothetical protein
MTNKEGDITKRIHSIATLHCADYPNVETTDVWDQLWAIESSLNGLDHSIKDWQRLVDKLQAKYNIPTAEILSEWETTPEGK